MSTTWPICPPPSELQQITFLEHEITVHRLVVPALRLVELRGVRTAYGEAFAEGRIGPTPTGAYNCRNRRPYPERPVTVARHSEHAHAIAIDVDYDSNPLSSSGVLITDFDRFGLEDGAEWLAAWLEPPEGLPVLFRWGGGWTTDPHQAALNLADNGTRIRTGVVDGMHFELALSPAECRTFDWGRAIRKEEEMNKDLQAAAEFVAELREQLKPGPDDATVKGAAERTAKAVKWTEAQRKAG